MNPRLRLLLLEDDPRDAELLLKTLQRDGLEVEATVVGRREDFERNLDRTFDVIVADYRLPDLSALGALEAVRARLPDVPFVFVSGSTTEDQLLAAMRLGADDYLLKDRLARLGTAVRGAVERHRLRRERARIEATVHQKEEELRHLQRIESIGLLAGGIAHDFNNLLTAMMSNTDMALSTLAAGHPAQSLLRNVLAAARRAAELTQRLLSFARRQTTAPQLLDLGETVRALASFVQPMLGGGIGVVCQAAQGLPPVRADRVQLEQVLMNLLLNARDAMPSGGTITIDTAADAVSPRSRVVVTVRDTGNGMTEEVRQRAFEPFFTTKPSGIGTGLGLSTALAIVRKAGGEMSLRSEPGQGTEVRVVLPFASEQSVTPFVTTKPKHGRKVLVLDEEPMLRTTIASVLDQAGYQVVAVASAAEIPSPHEAGNGIDLVLAEVAAWPALQAWRAAAPRNGHEPPIVLLSESEQGPPGPPAADLLRKPFTAQELLAKVGATLAGRK